MWLKGGKKWHKLVRNENGDITSINEIQGIIREFLENVHSNKQENLEEMDKCPDAYVQPKLNQEDKKYQNS
jgi:hypothetical protein